MTVNVGASPNDGTGDSLRDAFIKLNEKIEALEGALSNSVVVVESPDGTAGRPEGAAAVYWITDSVEFPPVNALGHDFWSHEDVE